MKMNDFFHKRYKSCIEIHISIYFPDKIFLTLEDAKKYLTTARLLDWFQTAKQTRSWSETILRNIHHYYFMEQNNVGSGITAKCFQISWGFFCWKNFQNIELGHNLVRCVTAKGNNVKQSLPDLRLTADFVQENFFFLNSERAKIFSLSDIRGKGPTMTSMPLPAVFWTATQSGCGGLLYLTTNFLKPSGRALSSDISAYSLKIKFNKYN